MSNEMNIADIYQGSVEYRANFRELVGRILQPDFRGEAIRLLHKALTPWNVPLEGFSWNSEAKNLSENQLTVTVASLFATIQLGMGGTTITAFNVAWSNADSLVAFIQAVSDAVRTSARIDFQLQLATLGFHVKPTAKSFKETLAQYVNVKGLGAETANMYGVSVYSNDYSFVIDSSAVVSGGIFIKLIRNFAGETRIADMAASMYRDEEGVLGRLGLKLR